jgi:hypothetical protein
MLLGPKRNSPFGVIAEYDDPDALISAAKTALDAGYSRMDAFTPFPVHGLPESIGFSDVRLPWMVGIMGFVGACVGMGLEYWTSVHAYPLNIGGRPLFSWPLFIPPAYETCILFAALTAVFGMIGLNKLPQPHHPVFSAPNFERASQDRFFLLVEAKDPAYDREAVANLLKGTNALNVTPINESEEGDW